MLGTFLFACNVKNCPCNIYRNNVNTETTLNNGQYAELKEKIIGVQNENDKRNVPIEAVGCIIEGNQKAKTEMRAGNGLKWPFFGENLFWLKSSPIGRINYDHSGK